MKRAKQAAVQRERHNRRMQGQDANRYGCGCETNNDVTSGKRFATRLEPCKERTFPMVVPNSAQIQKGLPQRRLGTGSREGAD